MHINLLTDLHWSYRKGFWPGWNPSPRQLHCESLRLAFSFAVCSLPLLATFPVPAPFCMPQRGTTEVYSSINSSAGNLPGCLHFRYNLQSPDSKGCLEIGSTVRGRMLHNWCLMCSDPFGVLCTNALGLAYLLQTAPVKQGNNGPLLLFIAVLEALTCLWNKSREPRHRAHEVSKPSIYCTTSAISFSQRWYTSGEPMTCAWLIYILQNVTTLYKEK